MFNDKKYIYMTDIEKQEIINLVLKSLKTNSLSIEQLIDVDELPDDAYIEISGGRKVSSDALKKMVESFLPGIDVVCSFGNHIDAVICQDFFTKQVKGRVIKSIDISQLDTLTSTEAVGLYHVFKDENLFAELIVSSDLLGHTILQYLLGGYIANEEGGLSAKDGEVSIMSRIYNISANLSIPRGTWGRWKRYGQKYELLSEAEYETLPLLDKETFYYTYEEE